MSFASLRVFTYASYPVSFLSKCHAKNRKEVLAVRTSYRKEVLALLSCSRKEVLAVSRTQAQATRNQPQEELLLADEKRSSCACIIFGLYCTRSTSNFDGIDWSKCFICKKKTYKKVTELVNISTFEACQSIAKAASIKNDEHMLHVLRSVNHNLVATEAMYHKNCYALYVAASTKKAIKETREDAGKDETMFRLIWMAFIEWYSKSGNCITDESKIIQSITSSINVVQEKGNVPERVEQLGGELAELIKVR